jgi:CHASE3 domain sensor protein
LRLVAVLITLGFFIAVQVLLVADWRSFHHEQQRQASLKQNLLTIHQLTVTIESTFRGYVLTKQPSFLATLATLHSKLQRVMERVIETTADKPDLQSHARVLSQRLSELVESTRQLTLQLERGEEEAVLFYIRTGQGVALARTIERGLHELEARIDLVFPQDPESVERITRTILAKLLLAETSTVAIAAALLRPIRPIAMPRASPQS